MHPPPSLSLSSTLPPGKLLLQSISSHLIPFPSVHPHTIPPQVGVELPSEPRFRGYLSEGELQFMESRRDREPDHAPGFMMVNEKRVTHARPFSFTQRDEEKTKTLMRIKNEQDLALKAKEEEAARYAYLFRFYTKARPVLPLPTPRHKERNSSRKFIRIPDSVHLVTTNKP